MGEGEYQGSFIFQSYSVLLYTDCKYVIDKGDAEGTVYAMMCTPPIMPSLTFENHDEVYEDDTLFWYSVFLSVFLPKERNSSM